MRQVFVESPWIHPAEPPELQRIFQRLGRRTEVRAGVALPHGEGDTWVGLLEKGLGAFTFADRFGHVHIFALIIPGRVFGDLDALTQNRLNLQGKVIRHSTVLLLERARFEEELSRSVELMKSYACSAVRKEEAHMEGLIANMTMDLSSRVRALFRSVISAFYTVNDEGWNPLPVKLSVTEIGQVVAANRSSVSLLLSGWIEEGLVRKDGRRLIVSGRLLNAVYDWVEAVPRDDSSVPDPELFLPGGD